MGTCGRSGTDLEALCFSGFFEAEGDLGESAREDAMRGKFAICAGAVLLSGLAVAQTSPSYTLEEYAFNSGGTPSQGRESDLAELQHHASRNRQQPGGDRAQ